MAHTFSKQLVANTPENVNDVMTDLNEAATDWEFAFSTYKTLIHATGQSTWSGATAQTYPLSPSNFLMSGVITPSFAEAYTFRLDPADFTAGPRTTKYRIRASLATNAVAPGITLTFGLYPLTLAPGASSAANTYTLGTVVSGSTVAFASQAANTDASNVSSDFTAPAAGRYVLAVAYSGTSAAGATQDWGADLQVRQV